MINLIIRYRFLISIVFICIALATLLFRPEFSRLLSNIILLISIGMAVAFMARNHWQAYMQAEFTLEKMRRNLSLELLGLLLTMAAATCAGGMAGQWAGMRAGLWAGLGAGFVSGFLAARLVRSAWGRLVPVR
jgi:hypothetical protein